MQPEIRLIHSWLYDQTIGHKLYMHSRKPTKKFSSIDECENQLKVLNSKWNKYEAKVLQGLCDITGLQFYKSQIDVYLAQWTMTPGFSQPPLIWIWHDPDEFVDTLAHELTHILLVDNKIHSSFSAPNQNFIRRWHKFYEKESFTVQVHIAVHAILKSLYLDTLAEPYRLERDISWSSKYPDYQRAWRIVEKDDYQVIISKLRDLYT